MIDFALEKYPATFPIEGSDISVRPLEVEDEAAFSEFFLAVPEEDRIFVKHRVTDGVLFHDWCSKIDYEANLPLLARDGDRIVADGTLHQRQGGWKRHIGLVSILILPEYRKRGVVDLLIGEIIKVAAHAGLARLEAEFNGERSRSIETFGKVGFRELVRLPNYVQDIHGKEHDYILMGMNLVPDYDLLGAGD